MRGATARSTASSSARCGLIPKPVRHTTIRGEDLRVLFEQRLDERGMEAA